STRLRSGTTLAPMVDGQTQTRPAADDVGRDDPSSNGREPSVLSAPERIVGRARIRRFRGSRMCTSRVEIDAPRDLFPVTRFPGPAYVYDLAPGGQRFMTVQVPAPQTRKAPP